MRSWLPRKGALAPADPAETASRTAANPPAADARRRQDQRVVIFCLLVPTTPRPPRGHTALRPGGIAAWRAPATRIGRCGPPTRPATHRRLLAVNYGVRVCFSAQADLVGGVVLGAIG